VKGKKLSTRKSRKGQEGGSFRGLRFERKLYILFISFTVIKKLFIFQKVNGINLIVFV
jgi:hypothetical protein